MVVIKKIFTTPLICSSPIFSPIRPNSSFADVVSPCLASLLLPSVPAILSIFSFSLLFAHSKMFERDGVRLPFNRLIILKGALSFLDLFISLLNILFIYLIVPFHFHHSQLPEKQFGAIVNTVFSTFATASYAQCVRAGFITSGSLHLAWLFRFFSLLPGFFLLIFSSTFTQISSDLFICFHLPISVAMVLLFCFSDFVPPQNYQRLDPSLKEMCPESYASTFSALTYSYASRMVWMGVRGTITYEDLWELQKERQALTLRDRFYRTITVKGDGPRNAPPMNICTFLRRIFQCTWEWQLSAILLSIFVTVGLYTNAIFLRLIVSFVNAEYPLWLSVIALSTLFCVDLSTKVFCARRDFNSFMAQTNLRSILCSAIFDKMLKLSPDARARYSAGELVNLLMTDVLRVRVFWHQIRDFVYCPFMIVVAFSGLWMEIGVSTLYGISVLIAVLPLNYVMSKLNNHFEQLQMSYKDQRMKLVNDVLSGIKVLKLYAWENSMQRRIFELRKKEVGALRMIFFLDAAITVSFQLAPLIATLVSFFCFTMLQHHPMRPDVAFVSLLFFGMLRFSIYQVPQLLAFSIRAMVSARRILRFLNEDEQQRSHLIRESDERAENGADFSDQINRSGKGKDELVMNLRNCSFTWESAEAANPVVNLRDICLQVEAGKLIGIVGRVGSGKSSLLSAILGEMARLPNPKSECAVRARSVGYVPQQAWIQNKTLRDNVLFDAPFREDKYRRVVEGCALEADLRLLPAGDQTEIGEKGINLSGGQKARVALARAVYMEADLYILDDTLSAVDAHVGAHIFDRVIGPNGILSGKTRLFALNSLSFLKHCDRIVVMNGGKIDLIGTLDELKQHKEGPFADLMREYMQRHFERQRSRVDSLTCDENAANKMDEELEQVLDQLSESPLSQSLLEFRRRLESTEQRSSTPHSLPTNINNPAVPVPSILRHRQISHFSTNSSTPSTNEQTQQSHPQHQDDYVCNERGSELIGRLTDEEELCTGMVSRRVYLEYARAFGVWMSVCFILLMFLGSSTFEGLSNVWLAKWSSANATSPEEAAWNLGIYGAFNAVYVISTGLSCVLLAFGARNASTAFHDRLVQSLFHSPMAFFDRTPLGRILNRLSNDIDRIDENIPWAVSVALMCFAEALNSLISICVVIPTLLIVALPLMVIFLLITHFYNVASVQFRRLTSKSWSSMCSFVQDAHLGADSIRVFNVVERFQQRCCRLADFTNESFAIEIFTNRWLQIRLDLISDTAVFICVLVAILMAANGTITLGALAMVIGCGYTFTGFLGEVARVWRESEVQMVCIERVGEYIRNQWEAAWRVEDPHRAADWPRGGQIQFRDFSLRYRPDTELVLKGLNFQICSGEKVGIVGRTGAGKSSLTLALFRIVEPASGQILIDGVDITTVGLHDLRQALTIIPQDPVLFCGSLRSNFDPFEEYSDDQIWDALEKAHLKEMVSGFEDQLTHRVAEGGSNLSVGQRQLVCLARALLRQKTRILVLDEATAAVDADTDARIQTSIRAHFRHCTVLTIAHRLHTILDYDRVLVMDAGRVAEFDTPTALLANPQSLFAQMAKQAGVVTSQQQQQTSSE